MVIAWIEQKIRKIPFIWDGFITRATLWQQIDLEWYRIFVLAILTFYWDSQQVSICKIPWGAWNRNWWSWQDQTWWWSINYQIAFQSQVWLSLLMKVEIPAAPTTQIDLIYFTYSTIVWNNEPCKLIHKLINKQTSSMQLLRKFRIFDIFLHVFFTILCPNLLGYGSTNFSIIWSY